LIESASSRSDSSENSFRGWNGHGRICLSATRRTAPESSMPGASAECPARAAGLGFGTTGALPNKAPSPRPRAGFTMALRVSERFPVGKEQTLITSGDDLFKAKGSYLAGCTLHG